MSKEFTSAGAYPSIKQESINELERIKGFIDEVIENLRESI